MIVRLATFAMGTRFEFVLAGEQESLLRAVGEEAVDEVQLWHRRLSCFSSDSTISHVNRHASERHVGVDQETFDLLVLCRDIWRDSGGAFDISVGHLMRHLGFRNRGALHETGSAVAGMEHVELDATSRVVRFHSPGLEIDLGGIGKGWALDRCAGIVRRCGVECALLHGGTSTTMAIGAPPDSAGWKVAIRDPAGFDRPVASLRNRAFAVSAPHGRMVESDHGPQGHVIDPRTGEPARSAILAGVICGSAALADAWSTALLVLNHRPPVLSPEFTTILCDDSDEGARWRIDGRDEACVALARHESTQPRPSHDDACVEML